jgi:hypothetical protein
LPFPPSDRTRRSRIVPRLLAARVMGASRFHVLTDVMLLESLP